LGRAAQNNNEKFAKMLTGDGEMSDRIRRFDWKKTPLGAIENWQQSLVTAVNLVLNSRFSMFVWWGEELTYLYNDAYQPTLGVRHPAALGKSAREVWAEIWDVIGPQAEDVIEKGESSWNEELLLFLERHGFPEETYHTFSYSPITDDFGKIGGLFCAVSEDTQKVLSRRRLQTLRDLGERTLEEAQSVEEACRVACQTLAENHFDIAFAAIYLLDKDGKAAHRREITGIEANHKSVPPTLELGTKQDVWKFAKVLQTGREQIFSGVEKKFGRLSAGAWTDDWTRQALILPLAKAGIQDVPAGFLVCGISPRLKFDDDYRSFLELAAGHTATAIANARALETERERAAALAELDRAKTEFFSNVSHEFRTPLTLMLGNLEEVLAKNGAITASEKEPIETAHRNSLRLLKLVNTLLDFSRIEAGKQQAAFEPLDLSRLTAELAGNFRSAVENAGLNLQIDCPPLSQNIFVDREMWEKIVLNLISNAFKFTFRGAIEINLAEKDAAVELKVKDSGVGIPADQLEEVFKRFHRVRQTEGRTFEGTGIGLSLVRELVRQHGGEIMVESELGKGTTFTVIIPKGKKHLPPEQIKEKTAENLNGNARAEVFLNEIVAEIPDSKLQISNLSEEQSKIQNLKSKILLADDNRDMREYVRRLLEAENYSVTAVADGQAALDFLQSEENLPDLILSDVMMPRMDGFQLLQAIRGNAQTGEIPVIMLSARAGEESKVEGLEAGADDYLVKPFAAREMLARVKTNLQMARLRRDTARREAEILDSIGDCFIALDPEYRLIYFNRSAEIYFGFTRGEVLGKSLREVFPTAQDSIYLEKYREALEKQTTIRFEARSVIKENTWLEVDVYPSGKGLSIYFRDITKRQAAEEKLRDSEERFRNMADHAPVMVWVTEADASCIYLNESWYQFTGQTPATGLGFGWLDAVHPDDQKFSHDIFVAANEKQEGFRLEYRLRRKDGSYAWAIDSAQPRFGTKGEFLGYIGSVIDISERKEAEEKLQASETQLRLVTDSIPALISYVDADLRYQFVNKVYTDWFGNQSAQIIGKHISEVIGEAAFQRILPTLTRTLAGEKIIYEQTMPYKNGGTRRVETNLIPDADEKTGQINGFYALVQDITERKEAEEKLRETNAVLNAINLNTPTLIYVKDRESRILSANPATCAVIGKTLPEIIGKTEDDYLDDKAATKAIQANDLRIIKSGKTQTFEETVIQPDGKPRIFLSTKTPYRSDGKIIGLIGVSIDITERKQAEKDLRDSEALLQGSIDALTKHIAVLDWRGRIINVNKAWRIFAEENSFDGYNYGIGSNYVEECVPLTNQTDEECEMHGIEAADGIRAILREENSYFEMEYPCHSPTQKRWFLMRVTSFGTGEDLHVVVAHEDVTNRKLAELEREKLLEREQELRVQAENANRLKDEFLATVSHELRTPLNAILGWSAIARKNESDAKTMQRAMEVIERAARNQNQIISDILEVSRIITGKLQLNLQSANLSTIIQTAVDTLRPAIDAKEIELKMQSPAVETIIIGDADRLQQVFWNILSNAVKFTSDGGKIEVSLEQHGRFAEITVKDNGGGIEPDFLPFVFDRFRQADGKMNRKHGGLGLGLAIVRHLTELHGGQVSAESKGLGTGATFTVRLPLKPAQTKAKRKGAKFAVQEDGFSEQIDTAPQKLAELKILVVDDEPDSLELASFILSENGAEVFTAASVDEALQIFERENLDLLISDIGMPERDGYELIMEIKLRNDNIPTLALTAYAREIDEKRLLHAGYRAYLPKPLDPARLIEKVLDLSLPEQE
jgi:PAS domain S-box-containing protein